jgi:hypothetical protein
MNQMMPSKSILNIRNTSCLTLILFYGYCCWLMLQITLQYIPFQTDIAFLRIKQDELALAYYLPAFYVHVYSSMFVLLAGFTQFSNQLRTQFPLVHRSIGYLYLGVVLLLAGPSGLVLAYHANGGWSSQLAFSLLAILWLVFSVIAWQKIRQQDWIGHRNFMIRSFALSLSAITLRLWKYSLVAIFAPRPMDVYRWVAWLGWVVNLLLAEWIIWKLSNIKTRKS